MSYTAIMGAVYTLLALCPQRGLEPELSTMKLQVQELAQMKLEVLGVEVIDTLSSGEKTLSAGEGLRLVVATIAGTTSRTPPVVILVSSVAFGAHHKYGIVPAQGIGFVSEAGKVEWEFCAGTNWCNVMYLAGKTVTLRLAFILPTDVTEFHVTYPAIASGVASLAPSKSP